MLSESERPEMMAACGQACESCNLRRLAFDPEAAREVLPWFRERGWLQAEEGLAEALERGMYCRGCHGDRVVHWSADCWILACAVDERGLHDCHECAAFPCQRLAEWAVQNDRYAAALARLKRLARRDGSVAGEENNASP